MKESIEELEMVEELLKNFEKQMELLKKYEKLKLIQPFREPPYTPCPLN